jgi:cytochrome c6
VKRLIQGVLTALLMLLMSPGIGQAAETSEGAALFQQHCAACHINGGNIIRRGKTLKLKALERQGIASVDAIAQIAREGVGQMSGYGDDLGPGGDQLVAEWIWEQAQNAWIQG